MNHFPDDTKLAALQDLPRTTGHPFAALATALDTTAERAQRIYTEAATVAERDQWAGGSPWAWIGRWGRRTAEVRHTPTETDHISRASRMLCLARRERYGESAVRREDLRSVIIRGTMTIGERSTAPRLNTDHGTWETLERHTLQPFPDTLPILVDHQDGPVGAITAARIDSAGNITFYGRIDNPAAGEDIYFGRRSRASWAGRSYSHDPADHRTTHHRTQIREISIVDQGAVMGTAVEFGPAHRDARPLGQVLDPDPSQHPATATRPATAARAGTTDPSKQWLTRPTGRIISIR